MRRVLLLLLVFGLAAPLWLPLPGRLLVEVDAPAQADAALLLDGSGPAAMEGVEEWRREGRVRHVVIVEAPVRTHALSTYWSELVARGIARPSPTPPEHLRVVRASSVQSAEQATAARAALRDLGARSVLVPGGGLSSRLNRRELARALEPAGISVRMVSLAPPRRDPGAWYLNADDRRHVLSFWLQLLMPGSGGELAPEGS